VRVLLIVNATASSVTARRRVIIQKALGADHDLEVVETSRRGHAARLARGAAAEGGVALSENLTGQIFVNQTAAFSDFHGTGANPAANAAYTDAAFVANRFRVITARRHVA